MSFVEVTSEAAITTVTLARGKVNAFNENMIEQIKSCFEDLSTNAAVGAIVITGRGKFFSFGFDIPEFLGYSKESFVGYLTKFTDLYTYLFTYPKPIIAALNGHTIAGGAMLALACDYRIMVTGKAKISLNEITFGSSVFAGSVEMLRYCAGSKNAQAVLYSGAMYSADEAKELGMIDQVSSDDMLLRDAGDIAADLSGKDGAAFGSIKKLLRDPIAKNMVAAEKISIDEFVEIWYSENTWKKLQEIKIHS